VWPVVLPPNLAPLADANGPYLGDAGLPVQFDASGSIDDSVIVSYHWDFGDGSTGGGVFPSHAYAGAGLYTVTLTVTDDGGLTDTTTTTALIPPPPNLPPIVVTGGPYEGLVGQPVNFDLSGTIDPEGDNLIFLWMDWGDGSPLGFPPPFGPTASHTYDAPGEYTVRFSVTDGHHDPTVHEIRVTIADATLPPEDNTWAVKIPFLMIEFTVTFTDIGGIYLVETTYPDGQTSAGIGMEANGVILWVNLSGDIFFGNIDRNAGTASGIMFASGGGGSVWFAEQL
jgi:PKD repeat protein